MMLSNLPTTFAVDTFRPSVFDQPFQARGIVSEINLKIFDGVFLHRGFVGVVIVHLVPAFVGLIMSILYKKRHLLSRDTYQNLKLFTSAFLAIVSLSSFVETLEMSWMWAFLGWTIVFVEVW
jgi:hypothetical protein